MTIKNKEFTMLELSNELQQAGYEDIFDNGNMKEILESGSVIIGLVNSVDEAKIEFEIIKWEENLLDVKVKVKDIYPF